ncbi:hypothetical protein FRB99_006672 [Tulasnella sp. 403]|nr:hypothetical protein FRB99_006672 [Tulasnella sp. 403]
MSTSTQSRYNVTHTDTGTDAFCFDEGSGFRYYMVDGNALFFSGIDGVQCEEFIQIVRRRALTAGKQRDNDWIIDFVTPCFIGDALRFHAALDDEVKDNWSLLQRALLQKYPAPEERVVDYSSFASLDSTIPTPASAPRQGLIRVHIEGSESAYYVSCARSTGPWAGCYMTTTTTTEALRVELVRSGVDLSKFKIVGHTDMFDWLGVTWQPSEPVFSTTSNQFSWLVGVQDSDLSCSAGTNLYGPTRAQVWSIGSSPGYALSPTWKEDVGKSWELDIAIHKTSHVIFPVINSKRFLSIRPNAWDIATLAFEPV